MTSPPLRPHVGMVYWDESEKTYRGWDGTRWVDLGTDLKAIRRWQEPLKRDPIRGVEG